ncbi:unnamed protein product [Amoebophrya sp. A120]|nr:unnamed protein product [Amoebophrya sp. A120]|eukprot:GSA120T00022474001.1
MNQDGMAWCHRLSTFLIDMLLQSKQWRYYGFVELQVEVKYTSNRNKTESLFYGSVTSSNFYRSPYNFPIHFHLRNSTSTAHDKVKKLRKEPEYPVRLQNVTRTATLSERGSQYPLLLHPDKKWHQNNQELNAPHLLRFFRRSPVPAPNCFSCGCEEQPYPSSERKSSLLSWWDKSVAAVFYLPNGTG